VCWTIMIHLLPQRSVWSRFPKIEPLTIIKPGFLEAMCISCCQTNSVRALMKTQSAHVNQAKWPTRLQPLLLRRERTLHYSDQQNKKEIVKSRSGIQMSPSNVTHFLFHELDERLFLKRHSSFHLMLIWTPLVSYAGFNPPWDSKISISFRAE